MGLELFSELIKKEELGYTNQLIINSIKTKLKYSNVKAHFSVPHLSNCGGKELLKPLQWVWGMIKGVRKI
jgi:hypothetical protein